MSPIVRAQRISVFTVGGYAADSIRLFVLRHEPRVYPGLALIGPNGERTMDTTGDLSDCAAEITHTDDRYVHIL